MGFPGGSNGKETACNMGDLALIPGWKRSSGEDNSNQLQYSCLERPEEPCGQRSLVSYSPWSCEELDKTERLTHIS